MGFLNRGYILYLMKVLFTFSIGYLIFSKIDFATFKNYFSRLDFLTASTALISFWIGLLTCAVRWKNLIKTGNHITLPLRELIRQVFISFSFSQALPSSIGGDVYRVLTLKKYNLDTNKALSIVLLDRFYGLFGFVCLSLFALPFYFNLLLDGIVGRVIILITVGLSSGIIFLLVIHRLNLKIVQKLSFLKTITEDFHNSIFAKNFPALMATTLCGAFFLVLPAYIIAKDLDINLTILQTMLIIPLVFLSGVLPISFAGWGLREGAMVVLLAVFGVSSEGAFALSVIIGILSLLGAIPGILMWFFIKRHTKNEHSI
jgi:uncharacterized protein (TIRG00374 family)